MSIFFSILITNYNKGKFLNKCINSCLDQNIKKNVEILVFDDCSTDNSLKILQSYGNKIFLYINKKKKFKSGPLNQIYGLKKLFKKSKGQLIFLLDGDDYFKKNKIEQISKYFIKNENFKFIQDTPYFTKYKKNFLLKKKSNNFSIWPSFYPTSSIVIKRDFFNNFFKISQEKKFPNLEIDARIVIFANLQNQFNIIKKHLTIYNSDSNGITSHYKKYSLNWWKKRNEAFIFLKNLKKKNKLRFRAGPDYYLTKLINLFI